MSTFLINLYCPKAYRRPDHSIRFFEYQNDDGDTKTILGFIRTSLNDVITKFMMIMMMMMMRKRYMSVIFLTSVLFRLELHSHGSVKTFIKYSVRCNNEGNPIASCKD
jgi:hypothetical protein